MISAVKYPGTVINPLVTTKINRFVLSDSFGWTPEQIDKMPRKLVEEYSIILAAKSSETERKMKREFR